MQKLYVDGKELLNDNMAWTKTSGHLIEKLTFQQYHGGSSSKFAPSKDQYIECASGSPL